MIGEAYKSRYSWGQATCGSIIIILSFLLKNKTDIGHPALLVSAAKQTPPRLRGWRIYFLIICFYQMALCIRCPRQKSCVR